MRRILIPLSLLLLLLIACRTLFPLPSASSAPISAPTLPATSAPTLPASPALSPPSTPTPLFPSSPAYALRLHPDGPLYVGDRVSLEIIAPPQVDLSGSSVEVQLPGAQETQLIQANFAVFGIGGRPQATLYWAWNTAGLPTGPHTLSFSIQPSGQTWTETVILQPQAGVPPPEPQAAWATAESDCCLVYYITGTQAEKDLPALLEMADVQAEKVTEAFGSELKEPLSITFLPRVLGNGGFASQDISVSYLERNYMGGDIAVVLHHEMVHNLDARLGGELRPTLLVEGLAVYLTGGHFKLEPLMPRAAALFPPETGCALAADVLQGQPLKPGALLCGLDHYLELTPLVDNFYFFQHEIAYLQAGALVEFIVETWGWPAFAAFYRDIHPQPEEADGVSDGLGPQSRAMQAALMIHYGLTLEQLEERFVQALRYEPVKPEFIEDVRLTVAFYDTARRYQRLLDPSAYFMTAWLLDNATMREEGIVADYLRHPAQPENVALETMLVAANEELRQGNFSRAEQILQEINTALYDYELNYTRTPTPP